MIRIAVAVHQYDGDRTNTVFKRGRQILAHGIRVRRPEDRPVGHQSFVHFDHALIQHFRQNNLPGKNVRPVLIADPQAIGEALCGEQNDPVSLALQQGVGGNGRAHFNNLDKACRDRCLLVDSGQVANALQGGIVVLFRVFGQQFVRHQIAVGGAGYQIGKGAAPVDPYLPGKRCVGDGHVRASLNVSVASSKATTLTFCQ